MPEPPTHLQHGIPKVTPQRRRAVTTRCLSHTRTQVHHHGCSLNLGSAIGSPNDMHTWPKGHQPCCLCPRGFSRRAPRGSARPYQLHRVTGGEEGSVLEGQKTARKKIGKGSPGVGEKAQSEPASRQGRGGCRHLCPTPCSHPTVNEAAGCCDQAQVQALCLSP